MDESSKHLNDLYDSKIYCEIRTAFEIRSGPLLPSNEMEDLIREPTAVGTAILSSKGILRADVDIIVRVNKDQKDILMNTPSVFILYALCG